MDKVVFFSSPVISIWNFVVIIFNTTFQQIFMNKNEKTLRLQKQLRARINYFIHLSNGFYRNIFNISKTIV